MLNKKNYFQFLEVNSTVKINDEESCERSNKKSNKPNKHENNWDKKLSNKNLKLPPSISNYFKGKVVEKGSVQAPFSKYPGRKTPHINH